MPSKDRPYSPRLSVEFDDHEDYFKLQQLLPYGTQKPLFNKLIKELIELLEVGGYEALALILRDSHPSMRLRNCMPTLKQMEKPGGDD